MAKIRFLNLIKPVMFIIPDVQKPDRKVAFAPYLS